VVLKGSTGTSF